VAWSCVFFLFFPVLLYLIGYLPYARAAGVKVLSADYPALILKNIRYMYEYHAKLEATHPYQSVWWQWMLDLRPILYYLRYYGEDYAFRVSFGAWGNPLFWWTGLGAMVCMAVKGLRGDRMAWFILAGYLSTLLPWVTVERCAFAYHYFPCTLFLALALGRCLRDCSRRRLTGRDRTAPVLALACALLFAVFYPALSGLKYSAGYGRTFLNWFGGSWPF
jgi:dolichyl-phosphate-mannose--protein O-mannosyl transferase